LPACLLLIFCGPAAGFTQNAGPLPPNLAADFQVHVGEDGTANLYLRPSDAPSRNPPFPLDETRVAA
jgi:hypothetical protein